MDIKPDPAPPPQSSSAVKSPPRRTPESSFTGLRPLSLVVIKQDVRNFMPWVMLISALSVTSILAYIWIFPDIESRMQLSSTLGSNPALSIIFGPAGELLTPEAFNTWRALALGGFFSALMTTFIVVRYTRADEDTGRGELFGSGVMGRQTRLAAATVTALVAALALGVVSSILTIVFGAKIVDTLLLCATFTATAIMFSGVAALVVQLVSDARTARSICVTFLGALFVLRGYFDASATGAWSTWFTPLGWMQAVHPGTHNNAWPFLLAAVFTVITLGAAFILNGRRDFGAGIIPSRPGPATAAHRGGIFGFTLRQNKSSVTSWLIAFVVLGVVFGYLTTSLNDLFAADPNIGKILANGATDQTQLMASFTNTLLQMVGIIGAVCGIQIVMRLGSEEVAMRTDPLLAAALPRHKYLLSYVLVAYGAATAALLIAYTVIAILGAALDSNMSALHTFQQGLVTIPAVWSIIALALLGVGAVPRARALGWLGVVVVFSLTIFGPMFHLWGWILSISPFHHVPVIGVPQTSWTGWWLVSFVTAILITAAFVGFRRRDID